MPAMSRERWKLLGSDSGNSAPGCLFLNLSESGCQMPRNTNKNRDLEYVYMNCFSGSVGRFIKKYKQPWRCLVCLSGLLRSSCGCFSQEILQKTSLLWAGFSRNTNNKQASEHVYLTSFGVVVVRFLYKYKRNQTFEYVYLNCFGGPVGLFPQKTRMKLFEYMRTTQILDPANGPPAKNWPNNWLPSHSESEKIYPWQYNTTKSGLHVLIDLAKIQSVLLPTLSAP